MKEQILKWNNDWRYDFWYRQKYKIAFNSLEHREANQLDIVFEYIESNIIKEILNEREEEKKREERFKKDGWISESQSSKEKIIEAFNKIDLKDF